MTDADLTFKRSGQRCVPRLPLWVQWTFSAVLGACSAQAWADASAGSGLQTLCRPTEVDLFTCHLPRGKLASLCGLSSQGSFESISYRYGTRQRQELDWSASGKEGKTFYASIDPIAPNARVKQVWFEAGPFSYVLTECGGGDCPHSAGLLVQKGSKVVSARRCVNEAGSEPHFPASLVEFGRSFDDSRSKTPLIRMEPAGNGIDRLYRTKRTF